jgi:Protein of unknown function (DUF1404)/Cytochrome c oxidase caa3 assembly factor (Caa3_CtaG)
MNSIISLGSGLSLGNFLWLCLFGILTVISVQSPILEITEQNLADHMVIEHTIFFFLGAASVKTAEIILRILGSHAFRSRTSRGTSRTRNGSASSPSASPQIITSTSKPNTAGKWHEDDKDDRNNNNLYSDNNNWNLLFLTRIVIRFWSKIIRKIFSLNSRHAFIWLLITVILLATWHWPPLFDYAVLHENIHILQHISFIIVGAAGFIALRTLGESFKIIILITLNAIMAFTGLLLSVTTEPVYSFYSINGHNEAGTYMLITCILLLLIGLPAYLIHRTLFHLRIKITEKKISDGDSTLSRSNKLYSEE